MFIENVSLSHIEQGWHYDAGENSMLIQIVDPDAAFPIPLYKFKYVLQFKFFDTEEENEKGSISNEQALEIAEGLMFAKNSRMNVIVHCHAGVCRSGAVAEVGCMMGFQDTEKHRIPNQLVKQKLIKVLDQCGVFN